MTMPGMSTEHAATPPWERIVLNAGDALIFIDAHGVIRVWNAMAAALFGFSAEEALGRSVDLIIPEHLREAHWRGFNRAMAHGHTTSREVHHARRAQERAQALRGHEFCHRDRRSGHGAGIGGTGA